MRKDKTPTSQGYMEPACSKTRCPCLKDAGSQPSKGEGQHLEEVESGDAEQFLGAVMGEGAGTELVAIGLSSARPAAELPVARVRQGLN